eukprot:SM000168S02594  [mRNA]  locus=s168:131316:133170:+ [translate_table: standard]
MGDNGTGLAMDPALMQQMLQNPMMQQMMQSVLSNPAMLQQLINMNPQLRQMLDSNPQFRELMQNPEFLRQMSNPESMQQMLDLQRLLGQLRGVGLGNMAALGGAGTTGAGGNLGLGLFGMGGATPQVNAVPPEQLYANQLTQLQDMGFFDREENLRALALSAGNVNLAVERLLSGPG